MIAIEKLVEFLRSFDCPDELPDLKIRLGDTNAALCIKLDAWREFECAGGRSVKVAGDFTLELSAETGEACNACAPREPSAQWEE